MKIRNQWEILLNFIRFASLFRKTQVHFRKSSHQKLCSADNVCVPNLLETVFKADYLSVIHAVKRERSIHSETVRIPAAFMMV